MKQTGPSKYIKFIMIPVLLGILYFVWPSKRAAVESDPPAIATSRQPRGKSRPVSLQSDVPSKPAWPQMSLSELENTDPFDRRMLFPEQRSQNGATDTNSAALEVLVNAKALQEKKDAHKIQAVFQSPTGIAALVANRVVQVGDQLSDGTIILGITAEQLVLGPPPAHTVN